MSNPVAPPDTPRTGDPVARTEPDPPPDDREDPVFEPPGPGLLTIDVSVMSYRTYRVTDIDPSWRDGRRPQGHDLPPGRHRLQFASQHEFSFTVDAEDRVDYDPAMDPFLSGRGSTTLTVLGQPLTIDYRDTSYTAFHVAGTDALWRDSRTRQEYRFIPGSYRIVTSTGSSVVPFTLTQTGRVDYAPALDPVLRGRGDTALRAVGASTAVDARFSDQPSFYIPGVTGWRPTTEAAGFRLLPGEHQVVLRTGMVAHTFGTDARGHVDYAPALDQVLDGRGTATLVVLGARPKWGYARAAFPPGSNQWGTWKQDPATAGRAAEIRNGSPGRYTVRFPALASARAVAHVTVSGSQRAVSCVVLDNRPDGVDQVVEISCHDPEENPADTQLAVLVTEPRPKVATLDTATGLGSGGAVRSVGTGEYEVTAPGFSTSGYPQVTPRGTDARRCHVTDVAPGARLRISCTTLTGAPADTAWALSYADGTTLAPGPGSYLVTEGAHGGVGHAHNSAGGDAKVSWLTTGRYRVGVKGVGAPGDTVQVTSADSRPGHCHAAFWSADNQGANEVWADVYCYTPGGAPADRRFALATLRMPGATPAGNLRALDPGPHPPGPKWGYYRVTTPPTPGVETTLHPEFSWSTWTRRFPSLTARWAKDPTVTHTGPGRYQVRLPGMATATGLPHLTPWYNTLNTCVLAGSANDGGDHLADVACFDNLGRAADTRFTVFIGEPSVGPTPMLVARSADATRTGPGEYVIAGLGATGHVQLTTMGTTPARCHPTGDRVRCLDIATGAPRDADWHLTRVEDSPLHHDPTAKGTILTTDGTVIVSYHDSRSTPPILRDEGVGAYRIIAPTAGLAPEYPADGFMVTPHSAATCAPSGWSVFTPEVVVRCHNRDGTPTDAPFTLAYLRTP